MKYIGYLNVLHANKTETIINGTNQTLISFDNNIINEGDILDTSQVLMNIYIQNPILFKKRYIWKDFDMLLTDSSDSENINELGKINTDISYPTSIFLNSQNEEWSVYCFFISVDEGDSDNDIPKSYNFTMKKIYHLTEKSSIEIPNSVLDSNIAGDDGGAIGINDNLFKKNDSSMYGSLYIDESIFDNNAANNGYGGSISLFLNTDNFINKQMSILLK